MFACLLWSRLLVAASVVLLCSAQPLVAFETSLGPIGPSPQDDSSTSQAAPPRAVDMIPVRRLVMYNVGVSQVLHLGSVDGSARMAFRVPDEKVDDLLKSFVFRDEAGGRLKSIQYRSAPSLAELAARDFRSPLTLAQLLQQQRGQEIVMEKSGGEIRGVIWGVENRSTSGQSVETLVVWVGDQLKSYVLADLDGVRFTSPTVQQKMKLSMQGLAQTNLSEDMRELHLVVDGEGQRRIGFGYLVDSTLWRMTYRMNVDQEQGLLQGWAHIDNSTGQDWEAVDLELRTGRPVVFSADLFAPLMVTRPTRGLEVFDLPLGLNISSPWIEATVNRQLAGGMGGRAWDPSQGMGGMGGYFGSPEPKREEVREFLRESTPYLVADGERWTTEVRYQVQAPVSLRSGESAALPVMTAEVPVRFYSVIDLTGVKGRESISESDQMIEITNRSQLPILGGPVTLQKQGEFLGDIVIDRLDVGAAQAVVYARERSLSANVHQAYEPNRLLGIRVVGRSLRSDWQRKLEARMTAENTDSLPRTVQLQVKVLEWDQFRSPVITPDPHVLDSLKGVATYELNVPGSQTETLGFTVEGQTTTDQDLDVLTMNQARNFLANTQIQIEARTREILEQWLSLQSRLRESQVEEQQAFARKTENEKRLADIRRDIELLKFDENIVAPLIEQLREAVAVKQQNDAQHRELTLQTEALRQELKDFYEQLELE